MKLKSALLHQFRNIDQLQLNFSERVNVFLGMNGQGKTNLLEALYFSIQGESFRYGDLRTLIRHGHNAAVVHTRLEQKGLDYKIRSVIQENKKITELNSKKVTRVQLQKLFKAIVFSPESLAVIKEGAEHRRELIDDLLVSIHPQSAELISHYRKILRSRNRLLQEISDLDKRTPEKIHVLESMEPLFIQAATQLTHLRLQAIREISQSFNTAMRNISNQPVPPIHINYTVSSHSANLWTVEEVEENLLRRLNELRNAEFHSGSSLVGPHKHDIVFLYGQNDSRFFCSQGQQRALILAFKMAQIVYHRKVHGEYPVMMLDDVLSELDQEKRQALVQFLHEIQTQTFITTTDLSLPEHFSELEISVFRIKEGSLCQTNPMNP